MPDSLELKKNCNFAILNKYMQIYRKILILMVLCLVCGLTSQASRGELYENFCCFSAVQEHFSSDSFKKPKKIAHIDPVNLIIRKLPLKLLSKIMSVPAIIMKNSLS